MSLDKKQEYFDQIANKWDEWIDPENIASRLRPGLEAFGVGPDEFVVDIGCGTGNLTRVLLERLSDNGRVVAVDLSEGMLAAAKSKNPDQRASFHRTEAAKLPLKSGQATRVICFSVWPHIDDPKDALAEFFRVIAPGGYLHIWHIDSRKTINKIHEEASPAVAHDVLIPAAELADITSACGFEIIEVVDDDCSYLITARRPEKSE